MLKNFTGKKMMCVILAMVLVTGFFSSIDVRSVQAVTMRRVIDNTHPMNMVSFYGADGETVLECWSAIPASLKPYSVLFILSESKNTDACKNNITNNVATCQANNIPCIVQPFNGETRISEHIPVSWLETLLQNYSCLIGYNAAELYNSIGWYGEAEGNHSQYIADLINMVSLYGAFFVWTDTNIFGNNGTMIDWIQNNANLIAALRAHKDNFIAMYKESYGSLNTDSLCLGLWLAGLASNWGISSDWWHWQVDNYTKLFVGGSYPGGWKQALTWPEALYVQSILRGMSEGATCFTDEAGFYSTGLHGVQTPGFVHAIMPFWSKIIDGTYTIPSKTDILNKNKFAYVGNSGYSVPYTSPYSNLYMSTGRYGIIPVIPANCNAAEKANFENISTTSKNQAYFDSLYTPETIDSNTFASRTGAQWYWMNSSENTNVVQYSKIKPSINTSSYFKIQAGPHTSAVIKESATKFTGHISNYRVNKDSLWDGTSWDAVQTCNFIEGTYTSNPNDDALRTTSLELRGSYNGGQPLLTISGDNGYTYSQAFDSVNKIYTLTINHNGPVNFEITADGSNLPQLYSNNYDNNVITNLQVTKGSPGLSAANGEVHVTGSSGDSFMVDNNSLSLRDCTYTFSMKPGVNARCGGIIRYVDNNTYTWIGYENDGHWRIRETINGVGTGDIWVQGSVLATNVYHTVQIAASNKNITVTCDGQPVYSGVLTNTEAAVAGKAGFVSWSVVDAYFDNVSQNSVVNLAAGKVPTTSAAFLNPARMTDGDKNTANYVDSYPNNGLQWAQLDLGASYNLRDIKLWHYFGDTRNYHDVIVQLSNDAAFNSGVTTVFNNDTNNSAGRGTGTDSEYTETSAGKDITFSPVNARYVRFYSNGSTANGSNHYVEVEIYQ